VRVADASTSEAQTGPKVIERQWLRVHVDLSLADSLDNNDNPLVRCVPLCVGVSSMLRISQTQPQAQNPIIVRIWCIRVTIPSCLADGLFNGLCSQKACFASAARSGHSFLKRPDILPLPWCSRGFAVLHMDILHLGSSFHP
jgi:hypothetical protein